MYSSFLMVDNGKDVQWNLPTRVKVQKSVFQICWKPLY